METLDELIADAEAELDRAKTARQAKWAEIERIDEGIRSLADELRGLKLAWLRRHGKEAPSDRDEWPTMNRLAAVERVLTESTRPMSPTHVTSVLSEHGRSDRPALVSAALANLKNRGRAVRLGHGLWVAPGRTFEGEARLEVE